MCDSASTATRRVRLPLTARTGFSRDTRRETCEKRRGLPKDSTYSAMTVAARVVGPVLEEVVRRDVGAVAERHEGRHPEAPGGRVAEQREAERSRLRGQREAARGACRPPRAARGARPRDRCSRGRPSSGRPAARRGARAAASSASSRSRPSGSSLSREAGRDDEDAAGAGVGRLDHGVEDLGGAGTETITSSGGSGRSAIAGTARVEETTPPPRLTAAATPAKPPAMIVRRSSPPTLPSRADAPTTATEAGASSGRSEATVARWWRSAIRSSARSLGRMSSSRWASPHEVSRRTPNPALEKTWSIARVSAITSASKRRDAAVGGGRGELLEHPGRQAAALHVVGDGEGDLRDARLVQAVVARDGDDAAAEVGDERDAQVAVGLGVVARDDVGAPGAVEAHVAALRREGVEERLDRRTRHPATASAAEARSRR